MSHPAEPDFKTLQFYSTAAYPCSYIAGREARSQVAAPSHFINTETYSKLVGQGFRRSGLFTYRPHCDSCQACLPIRINADQFQPNRTQRKVWHRHQDLQTRHVPLHFEREHFELYQLYVTSRHPGAGMDDDTQAQYTQFLLTSRVDSSLIEFRDPGGQLQMVALVDVLETGLSAVYTFFDPRTEGSLGTYGVLWQIAQCRAMKLPWLYLGYWIRESRKMNYKMRFKPHEILLDGAWTDPSAS
ncbi:MAG TPA: arginyltransferase [Eoetvoesiella sp.]